jgi:hypothetical protein
MKINLIIYLVLSVFQMMDNLIYFFFYFFFFIILTLISIFLVIDKDLAGQILADIIGAGIFIY